VRVALSIRQSQGRLEELQVTQGNVQRKFRRRKIPQQTKGEILLTGVGEFDRVFQVREFVLENFEDDRTQLQI
jgi:hypothetical protein